MDENLGFREYVGETFGNFKIYSNGHMLDAKLRLLLFFVYF